MRKNLPQPNSSIYCIIKMIDMSSIKGETNKSKLEGYVKETSVYENGKKFDLWHNPITGDWKKEVSN